MLRNTSVTDGFKRRSYGKRKSRKSIHYRHADDPAGRVFLLYVLWIGDQLAGHTVPTLAITRKFKDGGVTPQRLYDAVTALLPEYPAYYMEMTGNPLTPHIVYDRWHKKAVYTNGKPGQGGSPGQSKEHYTHSKRLRAVVSVVEEDFRLGTALTLTRMQQLGTLS